jgi:predicted AAA+ superfamily ATPase
MLEILKRIILDAQEAPLDTGLTRRLRIEPVSRKATVCIGVRRSGKSTYMAQRMQKLLDAGIARQNILSLNFFDDRLHALQHEGLDCVSEAYYSLYPEKKSAETVYCFFDEIQVLDGWEPFIERLLRTERCEIYITGSSAQLLSTEIATQMRGRALSWEIFPFSFRELLDLRGFTDPISFSTRQRLLLQKAFAEYWQKGGFPEVIPLDTHLRLKVHQEYFQTLVLRDIVERHDIPHPKAVVDLAHWLVDHTASMYSINRLTHYLQSLGHKIQKASVSDYLAWFEDAYCFFTVQIFDSSPTRRNANPKKVYCIDHAWVVSTSSGILVNSGHLLENLVFTALRRRHRTIYYYKTRTGKEVDFVVLQDKRDHALIQACETLQEPQTRKREVAALEEAMKELHLKSALIVTRNEEQQITSDHGRISAVPIWRFLLETEVTRPA